jgi:hypothetical protein
MVCSIFYHAFAAGLGYDGLHIFFTFLKLLTKKFTILLFALDGISGDNIDESFRPAANT